MKYLVIFLMILLLSFGLSGCKEPGDGVPSGDGKTTTASRPGLSDDALEEYEDMIDREDQERIGNPVSIVGFEDTWVKVKTLNEAKENLGGALWIPSYLPAEEKFFLYRVFIGNQPILGSNDTIPMARIVYRGTTTDLTIQIIKEPDIVESYMNDASSFDLHGITAYHRPYDYGARISWEEDGFAVLLDSALGNQIFMDVALGIVKD